MPDADLSLAILSGSSPGVQAAQQPNFFDRFDNGPDAPSPGMAPARMAPGRNFFDQFDNGPDKPGASTIFDPLTDRALAILGRVGDQAPQSAPPQKSKSGDPLTDRALAILSASPDELKAMRAANSEPERPGLLTRALAGANTGLIAQTLGAPVDAANWFLGEATRAPLSKEPGLLHSENPMGGSQWINEQLGRVGIGTAALPPADGAGARIAEQVGQGAGAMLAPFGAARAGLLPATAAKVLGAGPENAALAAGQQAAIGAGAGLGGGVASEVVPDNLKPVANVVGQLVGGGLAAGGMGLGQAAYRYGARKISDFRMPSQVAQAGEEALSSGAVPRAAPGGPDDVAAFFQDRLNAAEDLHDQHILQVTQEARDKAAVLGAPRSAQDIGKDMQAVLNEAAQREKDAASKLYQAVDPDGTLVVPAIPLREQVGAIQKDIPRLAKRPSGEEAAIYTDVGNLGESVLFRELQALRSRVSTAIQQEIRASGGESPELRRLTRIKAAINDTLAQGAAQAAEADPAVAARLRDEQALYHTSASSAERGLGGLYQGDATGARTAAGNSGDVASVLRVDDGTNGSSARAALSQPYGATGAGVGRPGNAPRGPQVSPAARSVGAPPRRPENIIDFLISRGGVFDEGGELRANDLNRVQKGQFGILSTRNGLSLDYAREAAEEAGFLRPGSTINDLLDAIQATNRGHPVYRPEDSVDFKMYEAARRRGDFEQGGAFDPNTVFGVGGPSQSLSEALDRYVAANQKYREYKETYRSGPIGKVLAPGASKGTFATPESKVSAQLTSAPEQIAAFEKAAGGRDNAIPLVHDQLASTVPRNADGTIDIAAYPRWLQKTSATGVFDAYPELKPRFDDAVKASEQVADANAVRLMAQRAHQRSAASLFTGGNDPVAAVGRALSGNNAEANMRELATAVKAKPDAQMGLKRAIVEYLRQRVGRQSEEGKGIVGNPAAIRFLRQNRAALRQIFDDGHLDQMEKLAASVHGGAHGNDLVTAIVAGHVGEHLPIGHIAEHATHGLVGKAVAVAKPFAALGAVIAKHALEKMRANGITRVDELMDEAMLNPQLARTMTAKLTPKNQDALLARFGNQLAMLTAEAPASAADRERQALDAVTRAVVAMEPGTAITTRKLAGLSGRSDITELRNRLVQSGLITQQNGRYVRAETANPGRALAPKEAPQPKGVIANPAAVEKAYKAIQERAPTLRRQSFRDLHSEIESRPSPYYGAYRPGGLAEHTAAIAEGTPLTHDVVHLLRRSGAIPRDEWSVLANRADDWAKRLSVEGPRGIRQEEAVAQAYNRWRSGDMQLPPGLRRIMGGISTVAERVAA